MKTILVFGDIVGRIGREAIKQTLPDLCNELEPDLVVANCENLAHGFGITPKTIHELIDAGIDVFTSGNHIWSNPAYKDVFDDPELNKRVIRPLNDVHTEGIGCTIIKGREIHKDVISKSNHDNTLTGATPRFLVISLTGTLFMDKEYPSFFEAMDKILEDQRGEKFDATIVDFHAEATSEKAVLGLYLDGKISILYGTHTHVPTADERILPKGTAFITDIGMVGAHNEAIGGRYDTIVGGMMRGKLGKYEIPLSGPVEVNAIVVKVGDNGKAKSIKRIRKIIEI